MRDSGGHSGNSFAETHIPLLVIGDGHCESNNEHFYKQTDFAATFSVINGKGTPFQLVNHSTTAFTHIFRLADSSFFHRIYYPRDADEHFPTTET